jgi:NAD(P)-dependent dehydrogenase (short-subunit alcohol dehydrogenase family)
MPDAQSDQPAPSASAAATAPAPFRNPQSAFRIPSVLVTGASRGLGRGIALQLAAAGCSVAINYAGNRAAADETAALCRAAAPRPAAQRFVPIQADISRAENRRRLVAETLSALGSLDALVNNAGIAPEIRADLTEATEESFEHLIRTNLQGPYFLTQAVVNHWLSVNPVNPSHPANPSNPSRPACAIPTGFKIIYVTSTSANTASISRGDYCISPAGLAMAAQLWAVRLAAENIQVIELRPGIMATDMTTAVKGKYDQFLADGHVPQNRWGTPEDVGLAVRAVIEGRFPFSTGAVIPIDGGFTLRRL